MPNPRGCGIKRPRETGFLPTPPPPPGLATAAGTREAQCPYDQSRGRLLLEARGWGSIHTQCTDTGHTGSETRNHAVLPVYHVCEYLQPIALLIVAATVNSTSNIYRPIFLLPVCYLHFFYSNLLVIFISDYFYEALFWFFFSILLLPIRKCKVTQSIVHASMVSVKCCTGFILAVLKCDLSFGRFYTSRIDYTS